MRSTIGRKVTTSLNRPRSRPFSSCIGKRLAEGNPVIGRASSLLSSPDRCILPALLEIDSATFSPDLSTPRKIFSAIARRPVRSRSTNRNERILEGEKDGRRFGAGPRRSATNRATESRAAPLFLEERRAGGGGKIPIQLDKTFSLWRCSNGPVYLLAYRDGRKESIKSKLGRDGGGFARDFVTSGRCFIDLNPLTGGTLRGYSPIVFTARDALEISSRPLPPRGEGSTYLRGFMSLPLVVKVS